MMSPRFGLTTFRRLGLLAVVAIAPGPATLLAHDMWIEPAFSSAAARFRPCACELGRDFGDPRTQS